MHAPSPEPFEEGQERIDMPPSDPRARHQKNILRRDHLRLDPVFLPQDPGSLRAADTVEGKDKLAFVEGVDLLWYDEEIPRRRAQLSDPVLPVPEQGRISHRIHAPVDRRHERIGRA